VATAQALRTLLTAGRFREAFDQYRELDDVQDSRRPDVQLLAATAATRLGELAAGTSLAEQALAQFRRRGDWDGSMRAQNLLGAIHWERGKMAEAEHGFGEALQLARKLGDSLMLARASNNLGSVAHLQGRSDQAAALYREALLAYQRLGDRRGLAETYHNLGFAYRQAGEWGEADSATANAVRHAEVVAQPELLALVLGAKAELSIERHDPALAERELARAEQYAVGSGDEIGKAEVQRVQALNALHQGKWELALTYAETAMSVARMYDSALLEAECAGIAARALQGAGRRRESAKRRQEAANAFGKLGATALLEKLLLDLEG
jgi:tetratricopeptide (TPR) repeat protein